MESVIDYIKKNKLLFLVIIPAFIVHMAIIMPSGSYYCYQNKCGLFFWGAHAHDAIWHLAIIAVSFNKIPFMAPTFAGSLLTGYNYLLDLVMFILSKAGVSPLFSYFKLFPIIWFLLMTWAAISLAHKLHNSPLFVGVLLFFIYFAGSFSYLLTLYHHKTIWGSSGLLTMQSGLTLTNLQFAFSLVVLTYTLQLIKTASKNIWLLSALTGINIALKFYAGALGLFIVFLYILGTSIKEKSPKQFFVSSLILFFISSIFVFVFYSPTQSFKSGSLFSFAPFATVHSIIEEPEQIYMKDMVNARYYLQSLHKFSPKLIRIELYSLILFLIFNFGTRIVGIFVITSKIFRRSLTAFEIYLLSTIVGAIFMATFFVQKGIWWNTIQFLYYALFLTNIFAAEAVYSLIKHFKVNGLIIASIVILLTLPTSIDVAKGFFSFPAPAYVSKEEMTAMAFLKKQPDGIVLSPFYDKNNHSKSSAPYPLAIYDDTSYVSAFSGKQTYAADEVQLRLLGLSFEKRYTSIKEGDCSIMSSINYIYQRTHEKNSIAENCLKNHAQKIFSNNEVVIYSTTK